MNITRIEPHEFRVLNVRPSRGRWPLIGDVLPIGDEMDAIIILNDAYLDGEHINSLRELKRRTSLCDFAEIQKLGVVEGEKVLPTGLTKTLKELADESDLIVVQDDHGLSSRTHWKIDGASYLDGDLIDVFELPVGVFWIAPENESWMLHTADDGPWIYASLPRQRVDDLVSSHADVMRRIHGSYQYLR